MKFARIALLFGCAAMIASCGGGGSSDSAPPTGGGSGNQPGTPPTAACSLVDRQNWVADQMREWYLFPETLPSSLNPAPYNSVQAYIDALTATARSQRRDRYFTYITSIAEENAYYEQGETAGFGIRLSIDAVQRRLFIAESFEGGPALAVGIDRGTEILAIGTSSANLRTIDSIIAQEGSEGVNNALGPSTAGTTRVLRISDANGMREVSVTKTEFNLLPVSSRYGVRIIDDGGRRVGYVNLRTFISTADDQLRNAFAQFRAQGITDIIVDFRYNGGGLISTANLMGDLLGGNRSSSDVFSYVTYRPEKSSNNSTRRFAPQSQSVSPTRIAFIGTSASASASELVINSMLPYYRERVALVGGNTYGKPVGQIAIDRSQCDDRLRVIAFALQNADKQGDYYDGLATKMQVTCQAPDDITRPLADPQEASTRAALDFLAGRSCTPITAGLSTQSLDGTQRLRALQPERPNTAQREVPGLF